jgi:hypothetical protein
VYLDLAGFSFHRYPLSGQYIQTLTLVVDRRVHGRDLRNGARVFGQQPHQTDLVEIDDWLVLDVSPGILGVGYSPKGHGGLVDLIRISHILDKPGGKTHRYRQNPFRHGIKGAEMPQFGLGNYLLESSYYIE